MTSVDGHQLYTAIHHACLANDVDELRRLLETDASQVDVFAKQGDCSVPFRPISLAKSPEAVDLLAKHGANLRKVPGDAAAPLAKILSNRLVDVAERVAALCPDAVPEAMLLPNGDYMLKNLLAFHRFSKSCEASNCRTYAWIAQQECVDLAEVDARTKMSILDVAEKYVPCRPYIILRQIHFAKRWAKGLPVTDPEPVKCCFTADCDDSDSDSGDDDDYDYYKSKRLYTGTEGLKLLNAQLIYCEKQTQAQKQYERWEADGYTRNWSEYNTPDRPHEKPDKLRALHIAIIHSNVAAVSALLADPQIVERLGERILNRTIATGYFTCIRIDQGQDAGECAVTRCEPGTFRLNPINLRNFGLVSEAAQRFANAKKILELLLGHGIQVNRALARAIQVGSATNVCQLLVEHGATFTNDNDGERRTPIGYALARQRKVPTALDEILSFVNSIGRKIDFTRVSETRRNGDKESVLQTFERRVSSGRLKRGLGLCPDPCDADALRELLLECTRAASLPVS